METKTLTIRLSAELLKEMRALAQEHTRSLNGEVLVALAQEHTRSLNGEVLVALREYVKRNRPEYEQERARAQATDA